MQALNQIMFAFSAPGSDLAFEFIPEPGLHNNALASPDISRLPLNLKFNGPLHVAKTVHVLHLNLMMMMMMMMVREKARDV